jgi:hypothetical protein
MRWAGRMARMRATGCAYMILARKPKGRYSLEDRGLDWKIILKWILGGMGGRGLCSGLTQDRNKWQALAHTVMNLWFS